MTYNSSPQTLIFKNVFPILMLGVGIIGFVTLKNSTDESVSNFANAFGIALVWISIFLIQLPFLLKKVEIDENGLKIISGKNHQVIPFKNINTISKFDLSNPWMITVNYIDTEKKNRKISYMPNSKYQRFMKEDEMTEYLIQKVKSENPKFETSNTLKMLLILFLSGLPFFIGVIYFMSKSSKNIFRTLSDNIGGCYTHLTRSQELADLHGASANHRPQLSWTIVWARAMSI